MIKFIKVVVDADGEILGKFVSANGAWKTYLNEDGEQVKVRSATVEDRDATELEGEEAEAAGDDETEEGEEGHRCKQSVFRRINTYVKHKTAAGNNSLDSGDSVAADLRSLTLDEAYEFAARELVRNGEFTSTREAMQTLTARYGSLNPGMQRMNLGNRLRGSHRRNQTATKAARK
jgi:hypothetical protein